MTLQKCSQTRWIVQVLIVLRNFHTVDFLVYSVLPIKPLESRWNLTHSSNWLLIEKWSWQTVWIGLCIIHNEKYNSKITKLYKMNSKITAQYNLSSNTETLDWWWWWPWSYQVHTAIKWTWADRPQPICFNTYIHLYIDTRTFCCFSQACIWPLYWPCRWPSSQ